MMPKFVLAWITSVHEHSKTMQTGGHVVLYGIRAWLGNSRRSSKCWESPEDALIREVLEETGLVVEIMSWNKEYYPSGWVAHAVTKNTPNPVVGLLRMKKLRRLHGGIQYPL